MKLRKELVAFAASIIVFLIGFGGLFFVDQQIYQKETIWRTTADNVSHAIDIYESSTPKEGLRPAVILCHGLAVSKEFFANFAIEFARLGYIAVTVELRGHGNSYGKLTGLGLNFTNGAELMWPNLSELENEMFSAYYYLQSRSDVNMSAVSAIGHSMGGGLVLLTSVNHPSWFRSVVVLAPMPVNEINLTNPRNLLLIHGGLDEAFTVQTEKELFIRATGNANFAWNTQYGNLDDGTARKFVFRPYDDHALIYVDPVPIWESVNWVHFSTYGDAAHDQNRELGDLSYLMRLGWMGIMIVGLFLFALSVGLVVGNLTFFQKQYLIRMEALKNETNSKPQSITSVLKKGFGAAILGTFIGIPITFGLFQTGMFVSAGMIGPLLGYAVAVLILFRKENVWQKFQFNGLALFLGLAIGTGFFMGFFAIARFFTNILPLTRIIYALIFGSILFFVLFLDELTYRYLLQEPLEQAAFKNGQISLFKRILIYIQTTIILFILKIIPALIIFLILTFLMGTNFVFLLLVFLVLAIIVMDFLGAIWFYYTRNPLINMVAFALVFGLVLVAISPMLAPLQYIF